MKSELEIYLTRLALELRKRGLADARIVEEARGHLTDATEQGVQDGKSPDAAAREAIARFGAPKAVAISFAAERHRMRHRLLLVVSVVVGLAIAYVDSRPRWDDAGLTAMSMLLSAGVFGLIGPQRPWLWALAVGIWIPLHALARTPSPPSAAIVGVLAFPFLGAYAGMAVRRALAAAVHDGHERRPMGNLHDRKLEINFLARIRKGHVLPEFTEADIQAQLVALLERAARGSGPLGASGAVQSLTLLEEATDSGTHHRRYRAVFDNGATIIVVHTSDGRSVSVHATPE